MSGRVALVAGATRGAGPRHRRRPRRGRSGGVLHRPHAPPATVRTTTGPRRSRRRPRLSTPRAALESPSGSITARPRRWKPSCARIDAEQGRLDILVNDIWGGEDLIEWNTPLWAHDLDAGLRMLHLARRHPPHHKPFRAAAAHPPPRRPGGGDDRRHARVQRRALPGLGVLRPRQDRGAPPGVQPGGGAEILRLHGGGADARLDAFGDDARTLWRHRGELAGGRRDAAALRRDLGKPAVRRACGRGPGGGPRRAPPHRRLVFVRRRWPASTASPTSTARSRTAGGTWWKCRKRDSARRCRPDTADIRRFLVTDNRRQEETRSVHEAHVGNFRGRHHGSSVRPAHSWPRPALSASGRAVSRVRRVSAGQAAAARGVGVPMGALARPSAACGDQPDALEAFREAWRRAEAERVEVACWRGIGRTGTALACIAILDGVPPGQAVSYVRRQYRRRTVETPWQAAVRRPLPGRNALGGSALKPEPQPKGLKR